MMYWPWDEIGENMQLCLAGLRDVDRSVDNFLSDLFLASYVVFDCRRVNSARAPVIDSRISYNKPTLALVIPSSV